MAQFPLSCLKWSGTSSLQRQRSKLMLLLPETELKISAEQAKKLLLLLHPRHRTRV